jgi:hypothetical protein
MCRHLHWRCQASNIYQQDRQYMFSNFRQKFQLDTLLDKLSRWDSSNLKKLLRTRLVLSFHLSDSMNPRGMFCIQSIRFNLNMCQEDKVS